MSCFIIAEAGVNHNGDEQAAMRLIDAAKSAGADAVKFQTFRAESLVTKNTPKAAYQEKNTGAGDQFGMLKSLELPWDAYPRLQKYAADIGIEFMSTPFDEAAADMLLGLGMRRVKIPSGELTNLRLLKHIAVATKKKRLPIILSTGMATLQEVKEAVTLIKKIRKSEKPEKYLTLLHCTSNYPAAPEEVNLRAMETMRKRLRLPVGYSDHTFGTAASIAATALGASMIEKHFTLSRTLEGPDHRASVEPDELAQMIKDIRAVEKMPGSGEKKPCPAEIPIRKLVRRSVTLRRDVKADTKITEEDLILLRPGEGIAPKDFDRVARLRAKRDLSAGTILRWSDLKK